MTVTNEQLRAAVETYIETVSTGTAAQIAELYAADASLEDPVGTEPLIGRSQIEQFYSALDGMDSTLELLAARTGGHTAAFHFRVTTRQPDQTIVIEPIDVMTFDEDLKITSMQAVWNPSDLSVTPVAQTP